MWKLAFFTVFVSMTALFADEATSLPPLSVDLMRNSDGGVIHTAVRCQADCRIVQTLRNEILFSITAKREAVQKIVDHVFKMAPEREITSVKSALPREVKSPMHWRFVQGNRITQGGFTIHPTPDEESRRMPLYQAILRTGQYLDRQLARHSK